MDSHLANRLHRVLRLIRCLDSGPRYNAGQLSREFQVSRRTIYRDIKLLREQGIPIKFDEQNDGYYLAEGCDLPINTPLARDELLALALAAHLGLDKLVSPMAASVREGLARLLRTYPKPLQHEVSNLLSASVTAHPSRDRKDSPDVVQTLINGISTRRQVRLKICDPADGLPQTKFAPFVMVITREGWTAVGRSSVHRRTCSFPLRNVVSAELTEDRYRIPRGFRDRSPLVGSTDSDAASTEAAVWYQGLLENFESLA